MSTAKHIADKLMSLSSRLMPKTQHQWLEAMQSEFVYIENDLAALQFASGCLIATWKRKMYTEQFEPLCRFILVFSLALWALAKVYLGYALVTPTHNLSLSVWQIVLISIPAIVYVGAAFYLMQKQWRVFIICIASAAILNTTHFVSIMPPLYNGGSIHSLNIFHLAVITEEYLIWTLAIAGAALIFIWPKFMSYIGFKTLS